MTEEEIFNYLVDNLRFDVETKTYGEYIVLKLMKPETLCTGDNRDYIWHVIGSIPIDERKHTGYF